jgi:hypothetical protein
MSNSLLKVTETFRKQNIKYAIVGGYAVVFHGINRGTVDIDILVNLKLKELEKVEEALKSLGLISRIPVSAREIAAFHKEYVEKRNLIAWSFTNPKNPIEIVDVLLNHDLSEVETVLKSVHGKRISVCQIDDLIRIKRKAGRDQDKEDVISLLEIKAEMKK